MKYPILVWPTLAAVLALGACAGMPQHQAVLTDGEIADGEVSVVEESLPGVELDANTLYDILYGEIAGARGQTAIASESLGRVAQRTRDPRLVERAALAAFNARRYAEALKAAQLWVELRPQSRAAHEILAIALLENGRTEEAERQFADMLADASSTEIEQSYMRIAAVLGRASNRTVVLDMMRALVARHADVSGAHMAYAHLAVRVGDLDTASAAVDEVLRLRPDWMDAVLFKARILVSLKEPAKAQQFFESFLDRYPKAVDVRAHYARFLIDQKQWEKAREEFKRVAAATPNDPEAVYAVGLLALQTNHLRDAEDYLKRALKLKPENDQARVYLGQVYEAAKRYREAVETYARIEPGEHFFEAQMRLALVMAKQGELEAARQKLRQIEVETEAQSIQLVLAEEQLLHDAKRYQEALQALNEALERMPGHKDLLYARALVAEKLDLLALLEADLRAILKLDPENVNALNALGYTLADRTDRFSEAREFLNQVLALKPDDPFVLDSIGWLHYRMGNTAEAVKYLKQAFGIRGDAEIAAHLGEVLWVLGDRTEAELVWDKALREAPDSEALLDVIHKFKEKK